MNEMAGCLSRRALSAGAARWQWMHRRRGSIGALLAWPALLVGAVSAQATQIQTLPLGRYSCELPGDALTSAGRRVTAEDFAIVHSSTYASGGVQGSYLLTSNIIEMTSGAKAGERFRRISNNFLRKLNADGTDGELRCVRMATNSRD